MGSVRRPLVPGVYVPTLAFFDRVTEDLDIPTIQKHAVRMAEAGVAGITTQGSNGEAVHLTHSERKQVTRATRDALDKSGFTDLPILVGCGAQSTQETIELCYEAQSSGGDYALILPPSYYRPFYGLSSVLEFFIDVASASPIPIIIYNFPSAAAGMDLTSEDITTLAKHRNIRGCKLTCGNTGKLNRITAATHAATPLLVPAAGNGNKDSNPTFLCLAGSADFLLQALIGGGSGTMAGLANIAPRACVALVKAFSQRAPLSHLQTIQAILARADVAATAAGVGGTKALLQAFYGYGGFPRRPLPRPGKAEVARWTKDLEELIKLEKAL